MLGIAIDLWFDAVYGEKDPHPGDNLLLEDDFNFLLETGDALLFE